MTIKDLGKIKTGNELKQLPFTDGMFVRFLKEKKLYSIVVKNVIHTDESYYNQTLRDKYLLNFFAERNYVVRLFPWECGGNTNWRNIMYEWMKTKNKAQ